MDASVGAADSAVVLSTPGLRAHYELIDRLGEGGFGELFRARQRSTGQLVAIKILHTHAGGEGQSRERR